MAVSGHTRGSLLAGLVLCLAVAVPACLADPSLVPAHEDCGKRVIIRKGGNFACPRGVASSCAGMMDACYVFDELMRTTSGGEDCNLLGLCSQEQGAAIMGAKATCLGYVACIQRTCHDVSSADGRQCKVRSYYSGDCCLPYKNKPMENSTTENSTTENSTTQNSTTENSTTENSTTENSNSENSTTENFTTENATTNDCPHGNC